MDVLYAVLYTYKVSSKHKLQSFLLGLSVFLIMDMISLFDIPSCPLVYGW